LNMMGSISRRRDTAPTFNQHSPNGRWFQSSLRHSGVPGKLGAPPTSSRRVLGHAESEQRAENANSVFIKAHVSRGF
jgi:hypothetical protein